jgi:cytoskeleton protein RodZ
VGSFGERLRREREMRGVSLDDIAEVTKIGTRLLRALEEEHFELLPGGIFNKGFVRAYAKYLGLNEEEAVADYLEAAGETAPDPRVIAEQNSLRIDRSGSEAGPSRQVGFPIIPVLILLLVIAAGAGGWQIYQERVRNREAKQQSGSAATSTGGPASAASSPAVTTPAAQSAPGATRTESDGAISRPSPNAGTPASPPATAAIDLNSAVTKNGEVAANQRAIPSSQGTKPSAAGGTSLRSSASAANPPSTQTFEVSVRAKDSAWVSIKSDGKFEVRGIIRSPDVKTVHASDEVVVWTGNAGAVEISFNGQPVPLAGGPNQEGVLVFNSRGVVASKPAQ